MGWLDILKSPDAKALSAGEWDAYKNDYFQQIVEKSPDYIGLGKEKNGKAEQVLYKKEFLAQTQPGKPEVKKPQEPLQTEIDESDIFGAGMDPEAGRYLENQGIQAQKDFDERPIKFTGESQFGITPIKYESTPGIVPLKENPEWAKNLEGMHKYRREQERQTMAKAFFKQIIAESDDYKAIEKPQEQEAFEAEWFKQFKMDPDKKPLVNPTGLDLMEYTKNDEELTPEEQWLIGRKKIDAEKRAEGDIDAFKYGLYYSGIGRLFRHLSREENKLLNPRQYYQPKGFLENMFFFMGQNADYLLGPQVRVGKGIAKIVSKVAPLLALKIAGKNLTLHTAFPIMRVMNEYLEREENVNHKNRWYLVEAIKGLVESTALNKAMKASASLVGRMAQTQGLKGYIGRGAVNYLGAPIADTAAILGAVSILDGHLPDVDSMSAATSIAILLRAKRFVKNTKTWNNLANSIAKDAKVPKSVIIKKLSTEKGTMEVYDEYIGKVKKSKEVHDDIREIALAKVDPNLTIDELRKVISEHEQQAIYDSVIKTKYLDLNPGEVAEQSIVAIDAIIREQAAANPDLVERKQFQHIQSSLEKYMKSWGRVVQEGSKAGGEMFNMQERVFYKKTARSGEDRVVLEDSLIPIRKDQKKTETSGTPKYIEAEGHLLNMLISDYPKDTYVTFNKETGMHKIEYTTAKAKEKVAFISDKRMQELLLIPGRIDPLLKQGLVDLSNTGATQYNHRIERANIITTKNGGKELKYKGKAVTQDLIPDNLRLNQNKSVYMITERHPRRGDVPMRQKDINKIYYFETSKEAKSFLKKLRENGIEGRGIEEIPRDSTKVRDSQGELTFNSKEIAKAWQESQIVTPVRAIDNYGPKILNRNMIHKKSDEFLLHLIETENINGELSRVSKEEARRQVREMSPHRARVNAEIQMDAQKSLGEKRLGSQHQRIFDNLNHKWYHTEIEGLFNHIESVQGKIAQNNEFGPQNQKVNKLLVEAADEMYGKHLSDVAYQEWKRMHDLALAITGMTPKESIGASILHGTVQNLNVFSMMSTSVFGQIPQFGAGAWRGNPQSFFKGLKFLNTAEGKRFVKEIGVNLSLSRQDMTNMFMGTRGYLSGLASGMLKKTGFIWLDSTNRAQAAVSGYFFADFTLKHLNKTIKPLLKKYGKVENIPEQKLNIALDKQARHFEKMNINIGEILAQSRKSGFEGEFYLTNKQKRMAAKKFEVDTNFRPEVMDMPEFRNSNYGRSITQFKSFMFNQTKSIRDNVFNEAKHGNFTPLLTLIAVSGVGGAIAMELRGLITKTPFNILRGDEWFKDSAIAEVFGGDKNLFYYFVDVLSAAGALGMLELFMNQTKYGDPGFGPVAQHLIDFGKAVKDVKTKGTLEPMVAWTLRLLPVGHAFKRHYKYLYKQRQFESLPIKEQRRKRETERKKLLTGGRKSMENVLKGYYNKKRRPFF